MQWWVISKLLTTRIIYIKGGGWVLSTVWSKVWLNTILSANGHFTSKVNILIVYRPNSYKTRRKGVRYLTWLQSAPFQQKLATALKIWIPTLHITIQMYDEIFCSFHKYYYINFICNINNYIACDKPWGCVAMVTLISARMFAHITTSSFTEETIPEFKSMPEWPGKCD